jgi:hypothetical protein
MTTVLGIFNKECVVLAVDSAVSYPSKDGLISRHNGNKIFPLSHAQPMAAMVYGASSFVGVPVELILGTFLNTYGYARFGQLQDCQKALCTHFAQYVKQGEPEWKLIHDFVQEIVAACLPEPGELEPEATGDGFLMRMAYLQQTWRQKALWNPDDPVYKDPPDEALCEAVGLALRHQIRRHCKADRPVVVDDALIVQVAGLVLLMLSRVPTLSGTGIVIVGYGEEDLFPSFLELVLEGAFHGQMRHVLKSHRAVTHFQPAFLAAFAQSRVIDAYLSGVDPQLHQFFFQRVRATFHDFMQTIVASVEPDQQGGLEVALNGMIADAMLRLQEEVISYQDQAHTHVTSQALALLCKEDLTEIAETMISMTAIKKRISQQVEDVGGPVDIAVLTKHDGFVWIQRKPKHSPTINPSSYAEQFPRCS